MYRTAKTIKVHESVWTQQFRAFETEDQEDWEETVELWKEQNYEQILVPQRSNNHDFRAIIFAPDHKKTIFIYPNCAETFLAQLSAAFDYFGERTNAFSLFADFRAFRHSKIFLDYVPFGLPSPKTLLEITEFFKFDGDAGFCCRFTETEYGRKRKRKCFAVFIPKSINFNIPLAWSYRCHHKYPKEFRDTVKTFLLCNIHLQPSLPFDVLHIIFSHLAELCYW